MDCAEYLADCPPMPHDSCVKTLCIRAADGLLLVSVDGALPEDNKRRQQHAKSSDLLLFSAAGQQNRTHSRSEFCSSSLLHKQQFAKIIVSLALLQYLTTLVPTTCNYSYFTLKVCKSFKLCFSGTKNRFTRRRKNGSLQIVV